MRSALRVSLAEVPALRRARRPGTLEMLAGCARNVRFDAGEPLFREGDAADTFYVVRHGSVALETFVPRARRDDDRDDRGRRGVGWSWLFAPYRWHFDARALDRRCARSRSTARACAGSARPIPALGYDLMSRFAQVLIERLQWTRLRLLDLYGDGDRS